MWGNIRRDWIAQYVAVSKKRFTNYVHVHLDFQELGNSEAMMHDEEEW